MTSPDETTSVRRPGGAAESDTFTDHRHQAATEGLSDLTRRITGYLEHRDTHHRVASEIANFFGLAGVRFGLIGDDGFSFTSNAGIAEGWGPVSFDEGLTGVVVPTATAQHANGADPDLRTAIPLVAAGEVIGVIQFASSDRSNFDRQLTIMQALGDQISMALESRRRIDALERRNDQLRIATQITELIASTEHIRDQMPVIVAEIDDAFGFGSTFITEIKDGRHVVLGMQQRLSEDSRFYLPEGVPITMGVIGRVARTGEPAYLPDARSDPDFLETSPEVESEICVPIRIQGRTTGVINVETPASRQLDSGDLEVLTIIASHLAIALEKHDLLVAETRNRKAIEAIQRVSTIVSSTLDPDEAMRLIVELLAATFGYPVVSFRLLEDGLLVAGRSVGARFDLRPIAIRVGDGVVGRVAATGVAEWIPDVSQEPGYIVVNPDVTSEIAVPISSGGALAGVLNIEGTAQRPVTEMDLALMKIFAEHAGTLLHNARLYEQMEQLASRDPITGLPNSREFRKRLDEEMQRAERYRRPLAVMVIDLDHFKQVNDEFGHLAGDEVLRAVGRRINGVLRQSDLLARYAGDEFVVILPESDREAANATAERLRDAVASEPIDVPGYSPCHLDLSAGVAAFPEDAHDTERLIKLADDAMYARKAETRRALLRAIETHQESESAISDSNTPARR